MAKLLNQERIVPLWETEKVVPGPDSSPDCSYSSEAGPFNSPINLPINNEEASAKRKRSVEAVSTIADREIKKTRNDGAADPVDLLADLDDIIDVDASFTEADVDASFTDPDESIADDHDDRADDDFVAAWQNTPKYRERFYYQYVPHLSQDGTSRTEEVAGIFLERLPFLQEGEVVHRDLPRDADTGQWPLAAEKVDALVKDLFEYGFGSTCSALDCDALLAPYIKALYTILGINRDSIFNSANVSLPAIFAGKLVLGVPNSGLLQRFFSLDVYSPRDLFFTFHGPDSLIGKGAGKIIEHTFDLFNPPRPLARSRLNPEFSFTLNAMNHYSLREGEMGAYFNRQKRGDVLEIPSIINFEKPHSSGTLICPFMIMHYCEDGDLVNLINDLRSKQYVTSDKVKIDAMGDLFTSVKKGHDDGIIFRDLKPENVLVKSLTKAVVGNRMVITQISLALADFGMARRVNDGDKITCGTLEYLDPAAYRRSLYFDEKDGFRWDTWAATVIAWHVLTGFNPPWDVFTSVASYEALSARVPQFSHFLLQVAQTLESVKNPLSQFFAQSLQLDPKKRPSIEVAIDLIKALSTHPESLEKQSREIRLALNRFKTKPSVNNICTEKRPQLSSSEKSLHKPLTIASHGVHPIDQSTGDSRLQGKSNT